MTNIEAYEATMDQQLRNYILTKDNEVMSAFHSYFELHEHNVNHILQSYEDSLNTHIQNMTIELWNSLDTELNVNSIAPVQNQAIANAFFSLENSFNTHNHNENYYLKSEIDTFLNNKVDKIEGYGLSQENFTTELKNKLNNLILISESSENAIRGIKGPNSAVRTGQIVEIDKSMIDLSNVDNTHDLDKPISTETQLALNAKAPINSPNFTGIPAIGAEPGVNPPAVDKQIATKGYVDDKVALINITSPDTELNVNSNNTVTNRAIITALNNKANLVSPNFTGAPTINGTDDDHKILTKSEISNLITVASNRPSDDIYFERIKQDGETNTEYYNRLANEVQNGDKTIILKVSHTFGNGDVITNLYCPYLYTDTNGTLFFGTYVSGINRFFYYTVDNTGQNNGDFAVPSTENIHLTGIPTAPTAPPGTNTTQIATTEFVLNRTKTILVTRSDTMSNNISDNYTEIQQYLNAGCYVIVKSATNFWFFLENQTINNTLNYVFVDLSQFGENVFGAAFNILGPNGWTIKQSQTYATTAELQSNISNLTTYIQGILATLSIQPYVRQSAPPEDANLIWIDISSGYNIPKIYINEQDGWQPLTSVWTA